MSRHSTDLPDPGHPGGVGADRGAGRPDLEIGEGKSFDLLAYSPGEQRFVVDKQIFPDLVPSAPVDGHDAFLNAGNDGNLYGTGHGRYFYRVDPRSLQVTVLKAANVQNLGNVYFVENGDELTRYLVPGA